MSRPVINIPPERIIAEIDGGTVEVTEDGAGSVPLAYDATISPGAEVTLVSATVPPAETWEVKYAEVIMRAYGKWRLLVNGILVGGGVNSPMQERDRDNLPPNLVANAGENIELKYTYGHGPVGIDIKAFVGVTVT